jgi:thymidylate synthase
LLKVRDGKLEWLQIMRSNDVFRGLPYNLVQFTTLHEIMAGWLGLDPGEYHHVSDSLHVYENSAKNVSGSMATPLAKNEDNLAISKSQSDVAFKKLENLVEKAIMQNTNIEELAELADSLSLPVGHRNMAFVLCAESARRRGRRDLAEQIITRCTSGVFAQLYEAWLFRVGGVLK